MRSSDIYIWGGTSEMSDTSGTLPTFPTCWTFPAFIERLPKLPSYNFGNRSAANFPCLNWGRNIFPFMSLFGIVWKLFGHLLNEFSVPMWFLKCRSFSILLKTLFFVPLVFFAVFFPFRILLLSNNSMLWLMVYLVKLFLSKMRGILGKFSCLAKTIQPLCFSRSLFWMLQCMAYLICHLSKFCRKKCFVP